MKRICDVVLLLCSTGRERRYLSVSFAQDHRDTDLDE